MRIKNKKLFISGLIIKCILGMFLASTFLTDLFIPFVDYFVESGFSNPYEYFLNKNQSVTFPYPSLMLFILAVPKVLLGWINPRMAITPIDLLIYRLPLLISDVSIFLILQSWLKNKTTKLIQLYWLSPVLIYITYIHGQLDVIPIAFLFGSLYFLFKEKFKWSSLLLGLGCACKTHIILVIPFYIIYLISKYLPIKAILVSFLIIIGSFFIVNLPFLFDESFFKMVFQNTEQEKLFQWAFTLGTLSFYVVPSCILFLLVKAVLIKRFNQDIFIMFLGFCFSIILLFVPIMQGWYFWIIPFLTYFYIKEYSRSVILLWSIQVAYLIYFGVIENTDYFEVFQMIAPSLAPNLANMTSPFLLFSQWGINAETIVNLSYTLLQTLLLFNCVWIYQKGLETYRNHKITSVPFLLGIGGNSGAGKTTLSLAIETVFHRQNTTVLRGDDMHKWKRGDSNWESMTHLNPKANYLHLETHQLKTLKLGKKIYRKQYDHTTGEFIPELLLRPNNLIIFEGLHSFYIESQCAVYDLKVFISPDFNLMTHWKIVRDKQKRNYDKETIVKQIKKREKDSIDFIKIQKQYADIIITPTTKKIISEMGNENEKPDIVYTIQLINTIYIEPLLEALTRIVTLEVDHHYNEDNKQSVSISGRVNKDEIDQISRKQISGLQDIGISQPKWPADAYGVIVLIIVFCVFEKESNERV